MDWTLFTIGSGWIVARVPLRSESPCRAPALAHIPYSDGTRAFVHEASMKPSR
jgi:hypothetical protein